MLPSSLLHRIQTESTSKGFRPWATEKIYAGYIRSGLQSFKCGGGVFLGAEVVIHQLLFQVAVKSGPIGSGHKSARATGVIDSHHSALAPASSLSCNPRGHLPMLHFKLVLSI